MSLLNTPTVAVEEVLAKVERQQKVPKSAYKPAGVLPVVDQGADFIGGYTDDWALAYRGKLPVIVFGDHTRILKFVTKPFAVGADGTQLLLPVDGWNIRYLYYALLNLRLKNYGYERHFKYLKEQRIPCHAPALQTRIASALSAYDDLIENNTRRIQILEKMAQAIYREWFVNFRFPGHEKVKLVDSPMGRIPQGWRLTGAPEAVFVNPRTPVPRDGMKPFVPMTSLSNGSMLIAETETREGNSGSKFKNGDTLFARITPCLENGKTGFVQFLPADEAVAFGSTEFIVLRSRTLTPEYVYLLARSSEFRDNAIKSMSGATGRQRVQEACFQKFCIAQPTPEVLDQFTEIVPPMFRAIHALALKNANLRRTRDLLLPKLISGEIGVSGLDVPQAD